MFLGVIISDSSSGRKTVLLNSCFWKNRLLENVGRGGQDVEGRAAGLGSWDGGVWEEKGQHLWAASSWESEAWPLSEGLKVWGEEAA